MQCYWPERGRESQRRTESFCLWQKLHAPTNWIKLATRGNRNIFNRWCIKVWLSHPFNVSDFCRIHFATIPLLKDVWHPTSHKSIFQPDGDSGLLLSWNFCWDSQGLLIFFDYIYKSLNVFRDICVTQPVKTFSWAAKTWLTHKCVTSLWTLAKTSNKNEIISNGWDNLKVRVMTVIISSRKRVVSVYTWGSLKAFSFMIK